MQFWQGHTIHNYFAAILNRPTEINTVHLEAYFQATRKFWGTKKNQAWNEGKKNTLEAGVVIFCLFCCCFPLYHHSALILNSGLLGTISCSNSFEMKSNVFSNGRTSRIYSCIFCNVFTYHCYMSFRTCISWNCM